ncbi:AraC family transcriptional regulator [Paraburkholderia rhizosphaerae]|uniref:AraC family transcriptional regulator n=1 Tax=Paraburkholderia rhizosphaerae TaxID=480658 RepID=A0A4R8M0S1_9BURK|nr:AraC family transcriptional regulator [Paraburkholderia rhizosphaerae]TDY52952.1 AraC family transcriptional regulator [Paraburkholderia rhizosphaerae]
MSASHNASTYQFSTEHVPPAEQFDAWREDASPLFDLSLLDKTNKQYDSRVDFTLLGPMMFGGRSWLQPSRPVVHTMSRSSRRIRADGLDAYYLQLQMSETLHGHAAQTAVHGVPGSLCVLDLAFPFDLRVTAGDTLCMVIPRDALSVEVGNLHGRCLTTGMGNLLADYLRSLRRNLPQLKSSEWPYAVESTRNILQACLAPGPDTVRQAQSELDDLLVNRIRRYIEKHLLSPDLSPDQICKDIGISRSRLYRLFEPAGGVMRTVQNKRLLRARSALDSPVSHRSRVSDVAWRHGFVNEKHFSRLFKAKFGCTPGEMAAQSRDNATARARGSSVPAVGHSTFSAWMRAVAT